VRIGHGVAALDARGPSLRAPKASCAGPKKISAPRPDGASHKPICAKNPAVDPCAGVHAMARLHGIDVATAAGVHAAERPLGRIHQACRTPPLDKKNRPHEAAGR